MKTITATIDAVSAEDIRARFEKFAAKAAKWGLSATMTISEPRWTEEEQQFDPETGQPLWRRVVGNVVDVEIIAPVIKSAEGWTLRAIVEWHAQDAGEPLVPVVIAAPGSDKLLSVPGGVNVCQHCNALRRRNKSFLVEGPDGKIKQVGSTCLKAYTGIDPQWIVSLLGGMEDLESEIDESLKSGSRTEFFSPKAILMTAARVVAKNGFVSRRDVEEGKAFNTTGHLVSQILQSKSERLDRKNDAEYPMSDAARALYDNAVAAIGEVSLDAGSAYEQTIAQLWQVKGVREERVGYLASAITLGIRRANAAEKAKNPAPVYAAPSATEGEKVSFKGRVIFSKPVDGFYGTTTIVKLVDDAQRLYTWFATGLKTVAAGEEFDVKGTVKAIEDDRFTGAKTAVITRCKLVAA